MAAAQTHLAPGRVQAGSYPWPLLVSVSLR